ncbi:MAG: ankyrin repeat domain-containing protein [Vicinamibacteria bacterium]
MAADDPRATALVAAIQTGDVATLERMLRDDPALATTRIVDAKNASRTLLHVAADWPGHFPNGARTVAILIAAGTDPDAVCTHDEPHGARETALHWAASSDDVAVLDALLDGGADIEAPGAVFTNGAPMSDAVIFAQWKAARRLLERGAKTTLSQAAALGLLDRVEDSFASEAHPPDAVTAAFWHACRGGHRPTAEYLLDRGAKLNWVGWDRKTPFDAAAQSGNDAFVAWLRARGGRHAAEL